MPESVELPGSLAERLPGEFVKTFTILTTEANKTMQALHHRMPAILLPETFQPWLSGADVELRPAPEDLLAMYRVGRGARVTDHGLHRSARAAGENPFEGVGIPPVDGEPIGATNLDHTGREPAPVAPREPLCGVLAALPVAVDARRGRGEVAEIGGETGSRRAVRRAKPGVMRFRRRHHVFDIGLEPRCEAGAGIGTVDRAEAAHDLLLDRLRVAVVPAAVVGRAAVLGCHGQTAPRLGLGGACNGQGRDGGEDEESECAPDGATVSPTRSVRRLSAMRAADAFTESRARWA